MSPEQATPAPDIVPAPQDALHHASVPASDYGWLPVVAITALAAVLRIYHLGTNALWVDEAFSRWIAVHPLSQLWPLLARGDDHPPLFYALLHLSLVGGDRESALRSVSALCGTLTIPVAYWLGWIVSGHRLAVLTALLAAVSPFGVEYSQDARMYPLLLLGATISMAGLAWLLRWRYSDGAVSLRAVGWTAYIFGSSGIFGISRKCGHDLEEEVAVVPVAVAHALEHLDLVR